MLWAVLDVVVVVVVRVVVEEEDFVQQGQFRASSSGPLLIRYAGND